VANPNTTDSLDLYAKVEDLLENEEAIGSLYDYYFTTLSQLDFDTLLDVGCGGGAFLAQLQQQFPHTQLKGIDLSPIMVARTKERGIDAEAIDLCLLEENYDVITAVFDMVNYLPPKQLIGFFDCIKARLNEGGYFLFDINTLYGFEQVAVGAYVVEDSKRFLAIDSDFESCAYHADFTLFEENAEGTYYKSSQRINQFYHPIEAIAKASGMQVVVEQAISLYGLDQADKYFVILQKK
jgi:SAM-dependent methyltransferase